MSPLWDRLRGFEVDMQVIDGHDPVAIRNALAEPGRRPRVIVMRTVKGRGVSFMEIEWSGITCRSLRSNTSPPSASSSRNEKTILRCAGCAGDQPGNDLPDRRSRLHGAGRPAEGAGRAFHQRRCGGTEHDVGGGSALAPGFQVWAYSIAPFCYARPLSKSATTSRSTAFRSSLSVTAAATATA